MSFLRGGTHLLHCPVTAFVARSNTKRPSHRAASGYLSVMGTGREGKAREAPGVSRTRGSGLPRADQGVFNRVGRTEGAHSFGVLTPLPPAPQHN